MANPKITHLLFDMDGLLLDTERHYTVAQELICAKYDRTFDWGLKSKMLGQKALASAHIFVDELDLRGVLTPEDFLRQREEALEDLFPTSEPLPGVVRLLRHAQRHGIPTAVATSSTRRGFALKTQRHGELFGLFSHVVTGDDVTHGKPAPDIFVAAAAGFSPPAAVAGSCLVFEDAPSGVAAALAAGMACVMVPDPSLDAQLTAGATAVLASLEDFEPEDWGLPPYDADSHP